MTVNQKALVLGASGGIGGEVARQLLADGWEVRALKRGLNAARRESTGIQWIEGDALNAQSVALAAEGCSVIVHAVNPPGYRNWGEQVLPMIENAIAAAAASGATIVLPGTIYNFGPDAFPLVHEGALQHPVTRKGKIRAEMERRLAEAAQAGAIKVIIVRAGDFFGPGARNNWLSQGMITPGRVPAVVKMPGAKGVGHQYAYLPDVAATMVALLAKRAQLPSFASYHMDGYWDRDGTGFARAIQRAVTTAGAPEPTLKAFPWWLLYAAAPFNETLREMLEMRYLWQQSVRMDNRRLLDVLGTEPHTPIDIALVRTLRSLACLPPHGKQLAVLPV